MSHTDVVAGRRHDLRRVCLDRDIGNTKSDRRLMLTYRKEELLSFSVLSCLQLDNKKKLSN